MCLYSKKNNGTGITRTVYLKMGSVFFLSLTKQIEGIFPSICATCEMKIIRFGAIC